MFNIILQPRYAEEKDYDYEAGDLKEECKENPSSCHQCKENPSVCHPAVGHFTQVVWKGTTKLGIGRATGKIDEWFCTWAVGRYSPAGNVLGQYQQNVVKP